VVQWFMRRSLALPGLRYHLASPGVTASFAVYVLVEPALLAKVSNHPAFYLELAMPRQVRRAVLVSYVAFVLVGISAG
jgi:hypothetical protein